MANTDPCRYKGHDWYGVDPLSVESERKDQEGGLRSWWVGTGALGRALVQLFDFSFLLFFFSFWE